MLGRMQGAVMWCAIVATLLENHSRGSLVVSLQCAVRTS